MNVTLINHSDVRGGASVVTRRLADALRGAGATARMVVARRESADPWVAQAAAGWRTRLPWAAEHLRILGGNGLDRSRMFQLSVATDGLPLWRHPWVRDADVLVLNWVNQGMLSLEGVRRLCALGKPLVWTMHDMWCATGGCHHAGACRGLERQCARCPLAGGRTRLTRGHFMAKQRLYGRTAVTFVAVSHWLAQQCRRSPLMAGADVRVIPNAFMPMAEWNSRTGVPAKEPGLIIMGAARLDDPVKGLPAAVDALNRVHDARPGQARAVLFGALRDARALDALRMPHRWEGPISDPAPLYGRAAAVLSSSLYETLPGTLVEGMAAGCVPVATASGGQGDIVDHLSTGYLARPGDPGDLAQGILWALDEARCPGVRQRLRQAVEDKFAPRAVADSYLRLFNELRQPRHPE